jgi:threonine dehydratase
MIPIALHTEPTIQTLLEAHERIKPFIHRTPVLTSESIDTIIGAKLFFKCENFQKVGAFKFRGACNSVFSLRPTDAARGVATHSSGNHAAALALAAKLRRIPAFIVMPTSAPKVKCAAVAGYGGKITFCEPTLAARESTLEKIISETNAIFIPPYNYCPVIAGQGTAAIELLEDISELDIVIAPVGGGGLLSGTAIAVKSCSPKTRVFAGEPKAANDAFESFYQKKLIPSMNPKTIADGLLTSLSPLTFSIIQKWVDAIYTAEEVTIASAMKLIWERMKIIIEPSCAVPLAAIMENAAVFKGKRIGIILSGGNVDLDHLPFTHSETP